MRLKNKVAIVTGGGVGIGKGTAERLAEEGAKVVIAQRREEKAREAAAEIVARGGQALGLQTDVTQRERVKELVKTAIEWGGGLDILVNNAGVSGMAKFSSFMDMTEELWDRVMSVNLKGIFLCSQEAARPMIEKRAGKIIHIASIDGLIGEEFAAAYCTSKAGVLGLTRVMALELACYGINVNCIAPGFIWTETVKPIIDLMESPDSPYTYTRKTPFGPGSPRDVGDAVVFLASEESKFFTGSTIVLDGGHLTY
jgi:3-oxoacyl-[acyl-carrier protein] reductase